MTDLSIDERKELVRIHGLRFNIIALIICFPVIGLIYWIKTQLMSENFRWNDISFIQISLLLFLLCLYSGPIIHELIRFVTLKFQGVKPIRIKYKNHICFLYSSKHMTVQKVKTSWLIPYVFLTLAFIVSMIFYNVVIAMSLATVLIVTSDSLLMFIRLSKYDRNLICIQEENFLGYSIIH